MATRTKLTANSEQRVKVEQKGLDEPTDRLLQSQYPARIKYLGKTTGKWYEWSRAGAIVSVNAEDAADLLSKQMNSQPCCNSAKMPLPKFVEVL